MMKDCEPLRGKIRYKDINWSAKPYDNFTQANLKVDDVASAFRFYKRYRDNKSRLEKERFDVYEKYITEAGEPEGDDYEKHYNEWLFNYSFKDAIK